MEVENTTPVPIGTMISAVRDGAPRTAIFTAKATFAFSEAGAVELERAKPFPLHDDDLPTELGLLPRDSLPRCDDVFEVMVLGRAYAPPGTQVTQVTVGLGVGAERRQLTVYGDRVWQGEGSDAVISAPQPFTSMPLVWSRAFGGSQEVLIDLDSPIDITYPINPDGKGFDHITEARAAGQMLRPPAGYPVYSPVRELPNLEEHSAPVRRWEDQPLPACWAPVPLHFAILVERLRRAQQRQPAQPVTLLGAPEVMHRAHPDWVIPLPQEGAPVEMHGLLPGGPVRFALPAMRVLLDVRIGDREERVELIPRSMVLLPEERRFYLVYRHFLQFAYSEQETRAARARLEPGWSRS